MWTTLWITRVFVDISHVRSEELGLRPETPGIAKSQPMQKFCRVLTTKHLLAFRFLLSYS